MTEISLGEIAHARSGDKGNHANIGVVANELSGYPYLARVLTAERVQAYFAALGVTRVERWSASPASNASSCPAWAL